MSAITQYIDLYDGNSELICRGSEGAMNSLRAIARRSLDGAKLPDRSREGFERTSVEEMMEPDFGINVGRVNIPVDVAATFRCGVPNMTAMMGVVVNDEFHPVGALESRLPEGVIFTSLRKAAATWPEIVDRYYGTLAPLDSEGAAVNTMLAQDGVMLYVPDGVRLEKPLQLVNIFSSPAPMAAFRRLLIIIGKGASAQLLVCDHTRDSERRYHSSQVAELILEDDASFDLYDLEESSALTTRYWQLFARQDSGSRLLVNASTLTCGTTRNEIRLDIPGAGCSTMIAGMAIASGKQRVDNNIRVTHTGEHSNSRQLFKYVLDDEASGAFEGLIEVAEGARFTEAYQGDKNLLASGTASMHTKPQLLIYCDDVKCSHGASTGQLDQKALFYMRQRGISEQTAKTMLMQAFMADVIDTVKMPGLQERLHLLVENRFNGRLSNCGDCAADCPSVN